MRHGCMTVGTPMLQGAFMTVSMAPQTASAARPMHNARTARSIANVWWISWAAVSVERATDRVRAVVAAIALGERHVAEEEEKWRDVAVCGRGREQVTTQVVPSHPKLS